MSNEEILIFFSAPIKGEREKAKETIIELGEWMKKKGIIILNEHVVSENPREVLAEKMKKPVGELTMEEIESYNSSKLCIASRVIAEVSGASTGVGIEVEFARTKGRLGLAPAEVLCLYHEDYKDSVSPMIRGMNCENVEVSPYKNIEEAKYIIRNFLGF